MFAPVVMCALCRNETLLQSPQIKTDPELEKNLKANKVSLELEYEKIKDSIFDGLKNIQGPRKIQLKTRTFTLLVVM
uniref:Uncharacterized protein n=1 Tax=Piliocolobus tephrosceles TaxID=591936 RepID=A0A8C9HAL4_9PRIM